MIESRWLLYALLSAACASLVGIFAKVGMKDVDATLATTIRSVVMTIALSVVAFRLQAWSGLPAVRPSALAAIVCSGLAGALSWLFYFKAIQLGDISRVAPIDKLSMPLTILLAVVVLGERASLVNWMGIGLIVGGAYLAAQQRL